MATEHAPRWLFIVRRDRPKLFAHLRQSFEDVAAVEVLLDRREREGGPPAEGGPPGRERRAPLPLVEQEQWAAVGFRLVYRADDLRVYEASTPGT